MAVLEYQVPQYAANTRVVRMRNVLRYSSSMVLNLACILNLIWRTDRAKFSALLYLLTYCRWGLPLTRLFYQLLRKAVFLLALVLIRDTLLAAGPCTGRTRAPKWGSKYSKNNVYTEQCSNTRVISNVGEPSKVQHQTTARFQFVSLWKVRVITPMTVVLV